MKGLINIESIWRRSLTALGLYHSWLFYKEKHFPSPAMLKMRNLYRQYVPEGGLCFDIGANMGSRVRSFLALKARVIAVEPQKVCYQELEKVFKNEPVTVVPKGVGARNEWKEFYIASNSVLSSFSKDWIEGMKNKHRKDNWDKVEKVEIVTVDMLIREHGMPDFIKIDTEGFEEEVLRGMSTPVKSLSFEYTLPDPQHKTLTCLDLVQQLYKDGAQFNICRDEAYEMHFDKPVSGEEMRKLVTSPAFSVENFGGYGDIYVKKN